MTNRLIGIGALTISASFIALSTAAQAQQATRNAAPIEEIIVTAQKRESALQDTPIAISAFSEKTIEQNQIQGISDVAVSTPGLVFAQLEADTTISLRGVGLNITGLGGEPAVATYQDGVYMGQSFTMSLPAFDLERIEVLRGPQGTLYGRNATGGAINLITRAPQFEPEADMALTIANYDHVKAEAGATGGLTDKIAVRGSIVYDYRGDGYRRNIAIGGRTLGDRTTNANVSALLTPTENLKITLRGNLQKRKSGDGVWELLQLAPSSGTGVTPANVGGFFTFPDPSLGGASLADIFGLHFPVATAGGVPRNPDDLEVTTGFQNRNKFDVKGASATFDWDIGDVKLKSITAYRDAKWHGLTDEDGTNLHLFHLDRVQGAKTWSQEINLSGRSFNDRLDWLLGAYYFNEDASSDMLVSMDDTQLFYEALVGVFSAGAPLPPGSLKTLTAGNPLGQGIGRYQGLNSAAPFLDFSMKQKSKSYALFGEGKYHLADNFAVTVGGRWTEDKKDVSRSFTSNFVSLLDPSSLCIDKPDSARWREVTGNVVAEYNVNNDSMLYGKASRGYKAGGYNVGECGGKFDPEKIWAYEAGLKSTFLNGQVRANSAIFYYDYKGLQILRYLGNTASVQNAAAAKIFGIETEFTIAPRALYGFQLSGSVGYLDTKYEDASFGNPFASGPAIDVSGNRLMRAPKWKASLAAQYGFDTAIGKFLLMGDANYTSKYYFDTFEAKLPNQSEMVQPSYTIANIRASWTPNEGDYRVMLFVENVTNKLYSEARIALPTQGAVFGQFSAPRTWGVRLSAKFGAGH
ncbi:TonB-dependent receptor [Sphingobium sp. EM0848]|uniref:TonB-dependent receptor n=1 Tax=Sphingobium sp. EM0848 TaxID=2743473 RepID=UPI00159CAA31|nr:TonB-dependent receptor [Sphingobium sp. EM0848]